MGEWKKPVAGGAVSSLFGFGVQFAEIPDDWKHAFAFLGFAGALLFLLWWVYLAWQDFKIAKKPSESLGQDDVAVSIEVAPTLDPVLGGWPIRIKITNKTQCTIQGVVAAIDGLSTEEYKTDALFTAMGTRKPHALPVAPRRYGEPDVFECAVNPQAFREFDILRLRFGGVHWNMDLAPYIEKGIAPSRWESSLKVMCVGSAVGTSQVNLEVSVSALALPRRVSKFGIIIPSDGNQRPTIIHTLAMSTVSLGLNANPQA